MSARRSESQKQIKRFGKMAEQYQEKINNQVEIITRLTKALTTAQQGLYDIENEAKDVRAARKLAKETSAQMADALKKDEEQHNE